MRKSGIPVCLAGITVASAALAANRAVQPDIGGNDAAVLLGPRTPGIDVLERPIPVLLLVFEHIGVESQHRRGQVHGVVAHNVVVVLEVSDHLVVRTLAVPQAKATLDLDGIAGPIQAGCLAQERPSAAVEAAAYDLVLGIIVGRLGIFIHVEAGKTP